MKKILAALFAISLPVALLAGWPAGGGGGGGGSGTDNTKVLKAGDTMTGNLRVEGGSVTITDVGMIRVGTGTYAGSVGVTRAVFSSAGSGASADVAVNAQSSGTGRYRTAIGGTNNFSVASQSNNTLILREDTGRLGLGTNSSEMMTFLSSTLVGLGRSDPTYRLEVASGAAEAGTIFSISTGGVTMIQLQGDGDVLANRFIGDGSQLTGLAGGGDAVLSATQTFSGNDTFNIPRGSTMTFNGNMKSTGVFEAAYLQGDGSRLTGIASGGGDAYLGSTQTFTAPQTFRSSVTVTNQGFSVGTSTFAVKNGLVGVGTSSPSYGFHVATGAYFEQGAEFGGALGAWTSPGTQFQIGVNGSVPLTLYSASMTVVGSTFVVRETGNIGIGTTNPSQRLVIAGGAGANVAVIQSSGGSVGLNITASDALGGYTAIGPTTNNPFFLQSNNLTRMTVGADGRVGVSTTSPVAALAVGGGITTSSTITAQGGFYGDGANLTNLTAANVSAGSLGGSVIASSITLAAMYGAPTLTGTNFSGVANTALDSSSVTKQGNTFNAANKLVLLNGSGELPALSAANLTSIPWGNLSGVPAGFADGVDDTSAGGGDNLGNHTATTTLLMAGFDIDNADSVTMASGTVTGANFSVGDSTFVVKAGQIGLGTTAPTATTRLDVSGTTMLRNTVYFSTNSSYNLGYNAALDGWYWAAPANKVSYMSTNQRLSIANDASATTGGGGTLLNLTSDKVWTVLNSTAGTGGQAIYGAINGAYGWGSHFNLPSGAVGALGYVVGVHGADQHGFFTTVDSTSGRGLSLFQSAATTVTPLLDIRAETLWQSAAYPEGTPSYSGTQSGPLIRALVRGTTEFMVAANGDTTIGGTLTATAFSGNGNALTAISTASLNATGTPSGTTYLRGDNTWATVSGSGDAVLAATQTWTGGNTKNSWTVFSGSVTFSSTTVSSNISTTSYTNQWVDFGAGSTVTIRGGLRDQNNSFGTMNYSALVSSGSDGVAWAPRALFGTIYSSTAASTSTSTYANAPTALGFAVVSGSTYTFSYDLSVGCSGTGGLRVGLIGPTITSVRTKAWGNGSATALIVFSTGSLTTSGGIGSMSTPFNTTNSTTGRVFVAGQIVPSADGFVQLVFSPVTSGQTATIYEGTTMQVWRRQ